LGCEHDSLEAARADFIDGGCIGSDGHASTEGSLSCRGLADAGLDNIAKIDLLYDRGVDFGLLKGALESSNAKFGRGEGFEGTIKGADRGASSSYNNNFVGAVVRLYREGRETAR